MCIEFQTCGIVIRCYNKGSVSQVLGEAEEKLLKAAQEVNQLRVEESTLRQENLQLRVNINDRPCFYSTLYIYRIKRG